MALSITLAEAEDAALVAELLHKLAYDLGDGAAFRTTPEVLVRHGLGSGGLFHARIAREGDRPVGIVFYFPHFSTLRGKAGVYVQDLWIAPESRGAGLGPRLLAAAFGHGQAAWQADYVMLTVHADNPRAKAFYDRLGFVAHEQSRLMQLIGAPLTRMMESGAAA